MSKPAGLPSHSFAFLVRFSQDSQSSTLPPPPSTTMDPPMTATRASDSIPVAVSPLMAPAQWPQNFSAMDLDPFTANPLWFGDLNTSGQEMLSEPVPFEGELIFFVFFLTIAVKGKEKKKKKTSFIVS